MATAWVHRCVHDGRAVVPRRCRQLAGHNVATGIIGTLIINNMWQRWELHHGGQHVHGHVAASQPPGRLRAPLTITGAASTGPLDYESLDCTFTATSGGVSYGQHGVRRPQLFVQHAYCDQRSLVDKELGGLEQCPTTAWPPAGRWDGRRQRAGGVRVSDSEGDFDRLGVDERGAAGQRNAANPRGDGREGAQRAGKILHVVPCDHVVGVAGFQLVIQALHQLILCSGCDCLHASLYVAQHSFSLVRRRRV